MNLICYVSANGDVYELLQQLRLFSLTNSRVMDYAGSRGSYGMLRVSSNFVHFIAPSGIS